MQKFKVTKEEFRKALKDISDWGFVSIELEGELLEGGTWKCTNGCDHYANTKCLCPCHNKKEEKCICGFAKSKHLDKTDFNRETPKEAVQLPKTLIINGAKAANRALENDRQLAEKINEILSYLKENEKNS